ncbi:hypothetical protein V7799_11805 [Rhizobium laguerreae]
MLVILICRSVFNNVEELLRGRLSPTIDMHLYSAGALKGVSE